jgi:DNA polymerase-1
MASKAPFAECDTCPLKDEPCVKSTRPDNWHSGLMIVGEAPGRDEVDEGKPFVGKSGQLLDKELKRAGIDRESIYVTNSVLCRPPDNKIDKYSEAISKCRPRLLAEIKEAKPERILALGATAVSTLLPDKTQGILKLRGSHHYSQALGTRVVVSVHPAYLLYMPNQALNFRRDLRNVLSDPKEIPETQYNVITSVEELKGLPSKIVAETLLLDPLNEDSAEIVCDTETSDYKPWKGRMLCLSLSWREGYSTIIAEELLLTQECREVLSEIFALPNVVWWGHNFGFDYLWLKWYGFKPPQKWYDTMILHYLTDETPGGHGLKVIAANMLGLEDWETELKQYVPKRADSFALIPKQVLHKYAARDTDINRQLTWLIVSSLDKNERSAYDNVLQPSQRVLTEMEDYGMLLDVERLKVMQQQYLRKQNDMLWYMQEMTHKGFNPDSPKQVGEKLFGEDGLRSIKNTPSGNPSTDDEVTEKLIKMYPDHKFLKLLVEYRSISKIIGTYLEGLLNLVDSNNVLHPDFNLIGTVTGRLSAGLLMTLPRVTKNRWAGPIRSLIIARPGHKIIGSDYNQAELRVMACEAREPVWRDIWATGRNLHDEMCHTLFGVGKKEDYEAYMVAKMFTFGLGYGRGPESIAEQLDWSVIKARTFHEKYMNAIPKVKSWQKWIRHEVRTTGFLETAFGRKRRFPLLTQINFNKIMNEALNFIPQSTASDLTLMSLTQYYNDGLGHPLLSLHDGIYVEVEEAYAEAAAARLREVMMTLPSKEYDDWLPFEAETKIGSSWGDAETKEE